MRGTGIDSDVEIYATKQSNEYQYMELKRVGYRNRIGVSPHLRTETDSVSETSCFSFNYLESGRLTKSENPVILCLEVYRYRTPTLESAAIHRTNNKDRPTETSHFAISLYVCETQFSL
jgi:hypothetical protein